MARTVSTFLMFEGNAEEAMTFYASLFADARVTVVKRYGAGEGGAEGSLMLASLELRGQRFMFFNSPTGHDFGFTPAISLFIDCDSEAEVDALYARLSDGGEVLMPLGAYPFSRKFGWVADRFGVSWQLNLPEQGPG